MRLSSLLGLPAIDAEQHRIGTIVDIRLVVAGDCDRNPPPPQLLGLVIGPRTRSSYLGYERSDITQPRLLAALLRWRHRGTFVADWQDIARVAVDHVTLRPGYTRYAATLRHDATP
jgi:hypothetical protein